MPYDKKNLRNKSNKKSKALYQHSSRRLAQRYDGTEYSVEFENKLIDCIHSGDQNKAVRLRKESNRVSVWIISYENIEYTVCYDSLRKRIITFLPSGCEGTHTQALIEKSNIQRLILDTEGDSIATVNSNSIVNSILSSFKSATLGNQPSMQFATNSTVDSIISATLGSIESTSTCFMIDSLSEPEKPVEKPPGSFDALNELVTNKRLRRVEESVAEAYREREKKEAKKKREIEDKNYFYQTFLGKTYDEVVSETNNKITK